MVDSLVAAMVAMMASTMVSSMVELMVASLVLLVAVGMEKLIVESLGNEKAVKWVNLTGG